MRIADTDTSGVGRLMDSSSPAHGSFRLAENGNQVGYRDPAEPHDRTPSPGFSGISDAAASRAVAAAPADLSSLPINPRRTHD